MGARDFRSQTVTAGSRWNNKVACLALRALCGIVLTDAQTGLRAIPASYMRFLLTVSGERFEFETNMLIELRGRCPLREIPARRVALSGGIPSRWSHFSADSLRIYAVLAMFALSSLGSTIVDLLLFQIFVQLFGRVWPGFYIVAATVGARICSATMNFYLNRTVVFRSRENAAHTALKYYFCSAVQMACSALLVTKLHTGWGGSELMVKMLVDFLLFFVNFQVQRNFVFHRKGDPPGPIGRLFAFLKRRLTAKKQRAGRAS